MKPAVDSRTVFATWWPLAASWLMMGLELPAVSAVLARLADPEIQLAAYGGVVFPLALIVEAPIIMLLAASTALSRDRVAYRKLRRFTVFAAGVLTLGHLAITVTPLYDWVVGSVLNAPEQIRGPARLGMLIMTPWTAAIAYRRFQQGVLIRFGRARVVGIGTAVRLGSNATMLAVGALATDWPGIAVGASAVAVGVVAEAIFVQLHARTVVRDVLPEHDPEARPLTRSTFVRFYTPLALTSLMHLAGLPIGSAAMGRMPTPLESLAVWPVINGLSFTLRSLGLAFNEVVVALLDRDGAYRVLLSFALRLAAVASGVLLIVAATPLAGLWFSGVTALPPGLADLARRAIWLAIPLPAASVLQAMLTGILVHDHRTRGISEAVSLQLLTLAGLLTVGAIWGGAPGLYVVLAGTVLAAVGQLTWLRRRAMASMAARRSAPVAGWATPVILAAVGVIGSAGVALAQKPSVPTRFVHEMVVGEPFTREPVAFTFLPDERIVLLERRTGIVRIARAGGGTSDSIFVIDDVNADHPERGLLGVAVDPDWPARPYLYFHFTAIDATVKVVQYAASGELANPASTAIALGGRYVLLDDIPDTAGLHNAGTLRFAPDGTLVVSVGDDGQSCLAQDLASPLGKLLRLDVSRTPGAGGGPPPLADLTPADNPFPGGTGYQPVVLALGLRNPFRFTIDQRTGDIFIGSVGQNLFEEINLVPGPTYPGLNFGWPQLEGSQPVLCCGSCGVGNAFTAPIYAFPHAVGVTSVIGGAVVRHVPGSAASLPATHEGDYLFLEIFSGHIVRLRRDGSQWAVAPEALGQPSPENWGEDFSGAAEVQLGPDGALYLLSHGLSPGQLPRGLHRIRRQPGVPPTPPPRLGLTVHPNPARLGEPAHFRLRTLVSGPTTIHVRDATGRTIRRLTATLTGGVERILTFDGRDDAGRPMASGVYVVVLTPPAGPEVSGKLVWIR